MLSDTLKKRFKAGEVLYGPFVGSGSEDLMEIIALGGFDYAIIDCEHSPCDPMETLRLIRAAETRGLPTLVRVNNDLPSTILKMMDIGADGVMVPLVHTAPQAKAASEAAKYYPKGRRGTALMRAADYGFTGIDAYFAKTNANAFVMVQAESVEAAKNLEAIAAVETVDSIFIGPYDLSQSMGIPGQLDDPRMIEIIKNAPKIIRAAGKVPGILATSYEKARILADWGYQLITYSADVYMFADAVREAVKNLKGGKK